MNVSLQIYPAVACISPPIGSSQADPELTSRGRGPGVCKGTKRISLPYIRATDL
jgi:hypothetical protein